MSDSDMLAVTGSGTEQPWLRYENNSFDKTDAAKDNRKSVIKEIHEQFVGQT